MCLQRWLRIADRDDGLSGPKPAAGSGETAESAELSDTTYTPVVSGSVLGYGVRMAQRYRGGRPSKGDRQPLVSRVATPIADAVRERAATSGLSVNDYIARVLAANVGLEQLAPDVHHEELPIADVA